jgi:catechol 2,3-dioxygenase-like lactoylglutathione lyase family enzyme
MRLNHIFIPSVNLEKSIHFYSNFLGFDNVGSFPVDKISDGVILNRSEPEGDLSFQILPLPGNSLPYSHHIAIEVNINELETLFKKAILSGLKPHSEVNLDSPEMMGSINMNGNLYRNFYVLDPSRVNIEILARSL